MMDSATSTNKICITGLGMVTSLGLDAATSCAAARSGLLRLHEMKVLTFIDDEIWGGEPMVGHTVAHIGDGFVGIGKALILGRHALQDLLSRRGLSSDELGRTGIYINLSDQFFLDAYAEDDREEIVGENAYENGEEQDASEVYASPSSNWRGECSSFIPRLIASCELNFVSDNQHIYFGGHTGIISAILDAREKIRVGQIDRCIIGGIESCNEPRFLVAAATKRVLKTSAHSVGFMPGEAAGFFMIEEFEGARSRGIEIAGLLAGTAIGLEEGNRLSDAPAKGIALAQVIDPVLSELAGHREGVGLIIGDLNGDDYRAMDWGYALARLQIRYGLGDLPMWLPAVAFGETGAATGALAICMGIRGFQRKYAPNGAILISLSSDNGSRGAICLRSIDV